MTLLSGLWAKVLAIGAVVGAVLLAILKIRQSGRDAERAEQARRDAEALRMANNAERTVAALSDDSDDYKRLRDKWTRR